MSRSASGTKKAKKQPQGGRVPSSTQPQKQRSCVQLSAACSDYCHALCNPFEAKPCGVPLAPIVSSQKTKVYAKGSAHTGTAGYGFVNIAPNLLVANDGLGVLYTTTAYAGSSVLNAVGVGVLATSTNAPFSTAQFGALGSSVSYRLVGCGLRVRYTGTELNRGGSKICLVDPTHNPIDNRTESDLLADPQAKKLPVTRSWTSLVWQPIIDTEFTFRNSVTGQFYMACLFVSPDASLDMAFEWEAYAIVEYQGSIARAQTHTFADPNGFAAVQTVSSQMNSVHTKSSGTAAQEMHKAVSHYVDSGLTGVRAFADTASSLARGANTAWSIFEDVLEVATPLLAWL